ncbi:amidohydrolase family protein [Leptolyngbya sp. 15MV]|nr:amidohydrolase family protein [Leptolyngbya sp. 15MV]
MEGEGTTGILDWLKSNAEAEEILPQDDDAPADADSTGSTGILSWLAQSDNPAYDVSAEQEPTAEEPTGSTGILNWLSQNRPVPPTMPLGQSSEEAEFSTENLQIPDNPDWLSELDDNPETATPRTGTGEMLDWLDDAVVAPGTTILSQEESDAGILPPDTDWLHEVYDEVKPAQAESPSTGEITWEDETWQPEAAVEEPRASQPAEEPLPDLPLTEPLLDDADESLVYTEALASAEPTSSDTSSQSGDDSFAALADLLQTGTLEDDVQEPAGTVAFAEGSDEALALTEPMSEEVYGDTDWLSDSEPLAFDPLQEAAPAAETNPDAAWDALHALAPRLRALGWQAHLWATAAQIAALLPSLIPLRVPIVLDHFGMPGGPGDPAFSAILAALRDGTVWVKATLCRLPDHAALRPLHDALIQANPHRVLWGSDWPYVRMNPAPDAGAMLDTFIGWVDDDAVARRILVDNPATLFGFDA